MTEMSHVNVIPLSAGRAGRAPRRELSLASYLSGHTSWLAPSLVAVLSRGRETGVQVPPCVGDRGGASHSRGDGSWLPPDCRCVEGAGVQS